MQKNSEPQLIELHPSHWQRGWKPPIGNDPLPGEKPHIWQEFKRDRDMYRPAGEPFWGQNWMLLPAVLLLIGLLTWLETAGGPEWLIALRNLF